MAQCHLEWDQEEIEEMIRQADADQDGRINFEDFYGIMSYRASLA